MDNDLYHILKESVYIPKWVISFALKNPYIVFIYECFHILIYKKKVSRSFIEQLKKILSEIRKILQFTHKRINIRLLLSSKKKRIKVGEIFGPDNINSGISISSQNPEDIHIIIYRIEDIFKVLIHEIIHYTGFDFRRVDISSIDTMIKNKYRSMANTCLLINEAYTEALAVYYYCLIMKKDFTLEQEYSISQTKRFLVVNGCDTIQAFKSKRDYSVVSHPFEYILLKSALINCGFVTKNISLLPGNSELIYRAFQKALSNKQWIDKVDSTQVKMEGNSYSMRLTF